MSKRLSNPNTQQKPKFQDKDDMEKSQRSQISDSQDQDNSQLVDKKQQKQDAKLDQKNNDQKSKFDLPNVPKFQALPLRDYFDAKLSAVLLEGLKEIGRQRPENPTKFLGEYLIEKSKQ
ncbi:hypothetical protein pb186bvf_012554 [Paramecium bursaria]